MLTSKRFAPLALNFAARSFIFAATIAVAVSFAAPARACPSDDSQPLRVMYLSSDRIVTARVGKTETITVEKSDDGDEREMLVYLKTALLVSSTLKGEHEPVVYVYHTSFGDYGDALSRMDEGKTFLAFLNRRSEEEGGFQIDNTRSGIKTGEGELLKIYTQRIEELDSIMQAKAPNVVEIDEWLLRCIEEPATRWEGAYDLWISHNYVSDEKQEDAPSPPVPVASEPEEAGEFQIITNTYSAESGRHQLAVAANTDSSDETQSNAIENFYDRKGSFIKALTPVQKNRLMQVLLDAKTLEYTYNLLIEVMQDWDDPRFVPFLLLQMRRTDDSDEIQMLMVTVAVKLRDPALKALMEKYLNSGSDEDADSSDDDEAEASVSSSVYQPSSGDDEDDQQVPEVSAAELKRRARVEYFIALAEGTVPKASADAPASDAAPEKP
jgi:hypothetical protein